MQAYLDTAIAVLGGQLAADEEQQLVERLAACLVGCFVLAAGALLMGVEAPYGRYSKGGWGCMVNGKVAWVVQESPNLIAVGWALSLPEGATLQGSVPNACLLAMFALVCDALTVQLLALLIAGVWLLFVRRWFSFASATFVLSSPLCARVSARACVRVCAVCACGCVRAAGGGSTTSTAPSYFRCAFAAASPRRSSRL